MKNILLLIVVLSVQTSWAQYYPLLDQTDWFMTKLDFGQKSYFWYQTIGDTTINNLDYKIVWRDSSDIYWLREDTSTKRVYIREAVYQTDFLVYDFSLMPNNSIPIFYPGGGAFTFTCDSVDYVTTMGGSRKRIWVTGTNGSSNTINMQWVEGVGNYGYLDGLFYLFEQGLQTDPLYQTVCAYQDTVQTFYDSVYAVSQNISCPSRMGGTVVSTSSMLEVVPELTFYGDPHRLYLSLEQELIEAVEIYTIHGNLLEYRPLSPSSQVEIEWNQQLPVSVYVLRVHTANKQIISKLFSPH